LWSWSWRKRRSEREQGKREEQYILFSAYAVAGSKQEFKQAKEQEVK
jgi:hypothetical protein